MSDLSNARATAPQTSQAPAITESELAQFNAWRQEQMGQTLAGGSAPVAAPLELAPESFDANVGELVFNGTNYGLIVARQPVVNSAGATVGGYKIVNLGVSNDTAAPLEALGYSAL